MKAIKDCEWEVKIYEGRYFKWGATSKKNNFGLLWQFHCGTEYLTSEQSAKHNWERFAKLNGIKKWKYV